MVLNILLCASAAMGVFAMYIYWRISNRGPKKNLTVEHREPGYRAWMDDTPIPSPRYGAIAKMMLFIIGVSAACSGVLGFNLAAARNNTEDVLPTRVVLELEETTADEFTPTEDTTPTETDVIEETSVIVATSDGSLIMLSTYTPYPTYTLYPTYTAEPTINFDDIVQVVERERVVVVTATGGNYVGGSAVVPDQRNVQQGQPQYYYQQPVYQPFIPTAIVIPANYPTPTSWPTATPAISLTPSITPTIGICATGVPQMFMTPTPSYEWWLPCYTPTSPPSETPVETEPIPTETLLPSETPVETEPIPTETLLPSETPTLEPISTEEATEDD
jgi:hypothetical protein